ncbi:DNA polymerase IV [Salinarimonas ramus]|uniref:DNA polymerase IV n=1 Tax=Salinarimonas ramus TaxID=690164 RepID=A0A917QJC7_9HYPH|nr:DNA polymerase IV [Salinarimonas ramus]GGK53432.1 DNA polymerase IV [Salinarimonas ramus]
MAAAVALCRDCLALSAPAMGGRPRCRACGSPRIVSHPELTALSIAHVDCDAFFATIEKRDDPSLADKPVIIGGGRRGVVSTCCYVARTYGVRSAMPMFKALDACPDAVVIRPNMAKYVAVGREVRAMMRDLTPLVEPLSIDEAFLDLSGTQRLHGAAPAVTLARFARRVEREIGITVSVGLAPNKFLAKIASDLDKPRGFAVIGAAEAAAFLADRPVGILPGIGAVAEKKLAQAGFAKVGQIARADPARLVAVAGRDGLRLKALAEGRDTRRVEPVRETKSVSAETTFEHDIAALADLEPILWRLAEKLAARLAAEGYATRSVVLKLKTTDFKLRTRTLSGLPPTGLATRLYEAGRRLLAEECDGTPFRLLGIGAGDLCDPALADRGDLADPDAPREKSRADAIAALRKRFGDAAVQRGIVLRKGG